MRPKSPRIKRLATCVGLGYFYLGLILQFGMAQTTAPLATRIAKANLQSVVTLVALDENSQPMGLGSGFFTTTNGLLATNAHVIEGAAKVVLRWQGQSGTADRIVRFDQRFDLVLLQTSFSSTPAVKLGDSEKIEVGEEIVALGSPYGFEGTVSTGIISGIRSIDGIKYLQITSPISPGSSGGPIFNANGVVVGVATSSLTGGQNLNFALPVSLIDQLPNSSLTFSVAKHLPPKRDSIQNIKDLVYANNVIDEIREGTLTTIAFSVQNKTNNTVCALDILFVIKNTDGEILNYDQGQYSDCIAPGLARQINRGLYTRGYRINRSGKLLTGSVEIRILNFKIEQNRGTALENRSKKK